MHAGHQAAIDRDGRVAREAKVDARPRAARDEAPQRRRLLPGVGRLLLGGLLVLLLVGVLLLVARSSGAHGVQRQRSAQHARLAAPPTAAGRTGDAG